MIVWLDVHLPPEIASWINDQFVDTEAIHLRDLNLREANDFEIYKKARKENVTVITKDSDFANLLSQHGPPPNVIWLTFGNTSNQKLKAIFSKTLGKALEIIKTGEALVEISEA